MNRISFIISELLVGLTSALYKPDTSLRRTVGVGPDGVCLRESSLYLSCPAKFVISALFQSTEGKVAFTAEVPLKRLMWDEGLRGGQEPGREKRARREIPKGAEGGEARRN